MSEKCRFRVLTHESTTETESHPEGSKRSGDQEGEPPHLGVKRRYHDDGGVGGREELWSLHDVIFTDRVQSVRVGRVVKIDGLFAAVHFPGRRGEGGAEREEEMEVGEEGEGVLERCRLLRKDDLVVRSIVLPWLRLSVVCFSWRQNR